MEESLDKLKIFLNYAKEDINSAKRITEYLKYEHIELWIDIVSLLPGQKWKIAIQNAIKDSDYFLALISSNSVSKKGFVQKELKIALDLLDEMPESEIFVIPVRLNECYPSHSKLNELHMVDLFPSWESGLNKLLQVFQLKIHTDSFINQSDIDKIVTVLNNNDPEFRIKAVNMLCNINDINNVEIISNRLNVESDNDVKYWLAHALGKYAGLKNNEGRKALLLLETLCQDKSHRVKQGALEALNLLTKD